MASSLPPDAKAFQTDFQTSVKRHMTYTLGKRWETVSQKELKYKAIALSVRDKVIERLLLTEELYQKKNPKRLYYLSMEYLIGRSLADNLYNLGLFEPVQKALLGLGIDLEEIRHMEHDAALGNGGLGRLAACFMESLATLGMPGFGYGINYEFGLFKQQLINGHQTEKPDKWSRDTSPWLIERQDETCLVPVYGRIEHIMDKHGQTNPIWMDWELMIGIPHDMPIVGYQGNVNYLRLFTASSSDDFNMNIFNKGGYFKAVEHKILTETVSKILYPSDAVRQGKELRLIQEYFLVACALKDIIRKYLSVHDSFDQFSQKVAIQLNDTHPALMVAELMRALIDEHHLSWDRAFEITQNTLAYTNHTLMPEALEKWPVPLLERVIPRHMQIIYGINHEFLKAVQQKWPNDFNKIQEMSIIEEGAPKQVRMAYLAIVGSHSVNGVAELHSQLIKTHLVPNFFTFWPQKFNNKTNGITPRRWLLKSNPALSQLITDTIGPDWITHLNALKTLEKNCEDPVFQTQVRQIKMNNKEKLARIIADTCHIKVDPHSIFDIQAKRIHEYKRQLLNALHIIHTYLSIKDDPNKTIVPKTYIFAGKAAPGYQTAKLIIKFINAIGDVVNHDPQVNPVLKVVFIPDYKVSLAERIIPAADISEQISTAGMEASGTGNMKFALNGALTVGTLDGANIEIKEEVGEENIYIFGHTADEIQKMRYTYKPETYLVQYPEIARVLATLESDLFCPKDKGLFRPIYEALRFQGDYYFLLADFMSYKEAQERVTKEYSDESLWARKAILNIARSGKFSSDRAIRQYADDIWQITSILP